MLTRNLLAVTSAMATICMLTALPAGAQAPAQKPNILLIVSDDTGYGDLGPYGGGEGRGMPTPSISPQSMTSRVLVVKCE